MVLLPVKVNGPAKLIGTEPAMVTVAALAIKTLLVRVTETFPWIVVLVDRLKVPVLRAPLLPTTRIAFVPWMTVLPP